MSYFHLKIELGNAAMLNGRHVADALRRVADRLEQSGARQDDGRIADRNGNKVGQWSINCPEAED